ncbi:MAG: M15 family metallopeptidase [Vicinamibacterales bacterium]
MPPLDALVAAYPDHLAGHEDNELIWKDGTRMPISDGVEGKSFDQLLDTADIDDMFAIPYVPGPPTGKPPLNSDPGRIRNTAFFAKLYGDCRGGAVSLKNVRWVDGKSVPVSAVNGLADRLQLVADELAKLPEGFRKFLSPSGGTYLCRNIAGTNRMSMHAFGAAIDISTATTDYWRWNKPLGGRYPYRNQVPFEIVEIFERYGFIWGGKWYHYDTMHFEYRPELFLHAGQRPVGF